MSINAVIILSSAIVLILPFIFTYFLTNKKKAVTNDDWAIGGRDLPTYVIAGTQFASAMGGGVLVALVGVGYKNGLSTVTYGIIVTLPLILLTFIAKWLRTNEFTTIPDMFESLYGKHKGIAIVSALLTLIVPFGWITSQLVAFGKLYSVISGYSPITLTIAVTIISLFFVMPSGLKTVAWTDFMFSCFMIVVCAIVAFSAVSMAGGWEQVVTNVPSELVSFPGGFFNVGLFTIVLWIFSALPGGLTNQIYYQRICAIKNPNQVNVSLYISAAALILAISWAFIMGTVIRSLNADLASEMATGWFLTQIPTWLLALFASLVVATIISTISSACQTVVLNITRDIYMKFINTKAEDKKILRLSRILSVITMSVACIMSIQFQETLGWLVYTYAFSAAALLSPIFLGYVFRNKKFITANAVMLSMIVGIVASIIGKQLTTPIPFAIWGVLASFITIMSVSYLEKGKKTLEYQNE